MLLYESPSTENSDVKSQIGGSPVNKLINDQEKIGRWTRTRATGMLRPHVWQTRRDQRIATGGGVMKMSIAFLMSMDKDVLCTGLT